MFPSNTDLINVDIKNTKIPSKDVFAKRVNRVNIISIDENLITIVFVILEFPPKSGHKVKLQN